MSGSDWGFRTEPGVQVITWTCPFCKVGIDSVIPHPCTCAEYNRSTDIHVLAIEEHLLSHTPIEELAPPT